MPYILRLGQITDWEPLLPLLQNHQHTFLEDNETLDTQALLLALANYQVWVFTHTLTQQPKGLIWFTNHKPTISVTVHLLIDPAALKPILNLNLISQALQIPFTQLQVQKIKALALSTQSTAIKLLRRYHFQHVGTFYNEAIQHGRFIHALAFELY